MVISEDEGEHDSSEPEVDLHENDNDVLESPYISRVDGMTFLKNTVNTFSG